MASLEKETSGLDEVIRNYQADITQLEENSPPAREKQRVLVQRHIHAQHKTRAQEQIRRSETSDALLRYEQFEARVERMEADADLIQLRPQADAGGAVRPARTGRGNREGTQRVEKRGQQGRRAGSLRFLLFASSEQGHIPAVGAFVSLTLAGAVKFREFTSCNA